MKKGTHVPVGQKIFCILMAYSNSSVRLSTAAGESRLIGPGILCCSLNPLDNHVLFFHFFGTVISLRHGLITLQLFDFKCPKLFLRSLWECCRSQILSVMLRFNDPGRILLLFAKVLFLQARKYISCTQRYLQPRVRSSSSIPGCCRTALLSMTQGWIISILITFLKSAGDVRLTFLSLSVLDFAYHESSFFVNPSWLEF